MVVSVGVINRLSSLDDLFPMVVNNELMNRLT